MRSPHSHLTTAGLKAEARQWREQRREAGEHVSHGKALEMVARFNGFRDWNTASAVLPATLTPGWTLGQRVEGTYLKQAFTGAILSLTALGEGAMTRLTIQFDAPVDVVTFSSFSAYRQRVVTIVGPDGISPARTGDGQPHMVLRAAR